MNTEIVPYAGWNRNLRLSNADAEIIITLDVGPRIISYKTTGGQNVFKNFSDQLGGSGETGWKSRGGHRLWVAPEDEVLTYHQDNFPVEFRDGDTAGGIEIDSLQDHSGWILKTLGVRLADDGSHVTVRHTARNGGNKPIEIATWGLSVMEAGGLEIIPQPALREQPGNLLPNRGIVLWPYTDLSDPRWHFGRDFHMLRQMEGMPPTKLGLAPGESWVAYVLENSIFIKTLELVDGATYPDGGCNFETYTDGEMLEIESLGPLAALAPGESVSHTENWHLFPLESVVQIESEEALGSWLLPFLQKAGIC